MEDEVRLAEALRRGLAGDGFEVDVVHDGASALSYVDRSAYELMVLDRDLPVLHGDIVARTLRDSGSPIRILMLTASSQTSDKVDGLRLGADDYLAKPFEYDELLARLMAMSRRIRGQAGALERAGLRVDPVAKRAWADDAEVRLRPKELGVLTELLRAAGGVVSPSALFDTVWEGSDDVDEAVVKTVVHSLRKKLGTASIETVHGFGYRIAS
ncbi:response regulator transcription factor [Microbacterium sp.]|uniref:response regulator transcription factor n=1 Tax=Microbacterium sp. TaxID=51671 RepID=UPI0028117757|nr:response regulator transcription factor [Microbacterium sp.]